MRKELACLVLGLSLFVGCGGGEKVIRVTPPSITNQLRDVLEQIADAGIIDSSIAVSYTNLTLPTKRIV